MPSMTAGQYRFLSDVKELDDIQLGCLAVRLSIGTKKKRAHLENQCIARQWIRIESRDDVWSRTIYLTTRGLRSLRVAEKRFGSLHSEA